ncbi:MAG: 2-oxo acid dehydrogenase subunit E2 [Alphaproteobacteria bacterium]|nr:2-oxo acid dehydrogenase subunit E2 [Alphaproteobacteria bacterium]
MGRYVFRLPDVGEGIAEVEVVNWHVAPGATVAEDDPLVDVMTDKATVELPSPRAGKVLSTTGNPGDKIRVGSELVVLEVEGAGEAPAQERSAPPPPAVATKPAKQSEAPAPKPQPIERPAEPVAKAPPGEKPLASPAVRHRAYQLGIPLQFVAGTGPAGRILHADLDSYVASGGRAAPATRAPREAVEEIKIIGLRRRIAERMQESKRHIPHYSYVEELDVTELEELRTHLNTQHAEDRPRLTLLPFLVAALVRAVPKFPQVNAQFDDEAGIVRRHAALHVGIATQTTQGLMVPVVRHAETLDLWQTAAEVARLSTATRDGKATRDELTGSTITITSLGALGGIVSTPVINRPEVAIVGVNRIVERPVVRGGQIVVRKMMNLSSSFDHRVVDGWDAAQFIQELKRLLEQPATLFIA